MGLIVGCNSASDSTTPRDESIDISALVALPLPARRYNCLARILRLT